LIDFVGQDCGLRLDWKVGGAESDAELIVITSRPLLTVELLAQRKIPKRANQTLTSVNRNSAPVQLTL
jgi:hypothetical protein